MLDALVGSHAVSPPSGPIPESVETASNLSSRQIQYGALSVSLFFSSLPLLFLPTL